MANLASFDLNLLRVLDVLLKENSTVRAGERVGLSQPAVSAALSRLRASLGDELFFRRGQGLEPTQYARSLQEPLREIMAGIETLIGGPGDFTPETSDASFRISGSDFFAELLMPQLAERLQKHAPAMRVHLVDLVPDSYVDTLDRYEVDFALIPRIDLPDWIESASVFQSGFLVIARAGHPRLSRAGLAPGDVVPLDLFCDLGHVLFSPEGNSRAMGDAALAKLGRERRVVMTMPVFSGVYRAVAGSDLVALLPSALARHIADAAGLEVFRPPMPVPTAHINLIWHRRFSASPAHNWMRHQIAELLAPLDEAAT
ncbi:LysR family transcriptional regulator [Ponticoccus sp. SC2-23]|uniref:LysR family transcriptional regulator n=1 Tax=Alexandriicola marinus TaxID=2081710 RepID=UPI000FDABCF1|nr:LysR family transcriptional regulator [Alexandriicola marinus]MBM1220754.1 LysR family transcriptional regulator [Ponticoccus sp. SC6-9]MBM1226013.1 LysR family transcriptional regulator [Ponticoccus sp. SC6-15]MBM1231310.1 LysR family transcriptional regulator [Ponticoccus sp. SC6-38]MBM1235829.1 LysR family transcriptional regulator [Ponticoccus sp. SC6-45]MBM1240333.1 LysR family transcriptional regulator [Ponticoccus sp. SC6-49]MBM1244868.1 LysR family transcriptional regulator [Pontic